MNLLFWNLKNNSIEIHIANCIVENNIDIAAFAEYKGIDQNNLKSLLSNQYHFVQHELSYINSKVIIFIKKSISVRPVYEDKRFCIYNVNTIISHYILAVVHLEDRLNYNSIDRIKTIAKLIEHINQIEQEFKCDKTIIIGDFNANPYDEELLSIYAFNSILFKKVIMKNDVREKNQLCYKCFYNPILNYISEETETYGSFYYSGDSFTPFWYCLDQVLLRKNLINCLSNLQYLKRIGDIELINQVKPNSSISDHLPLLVIIEEVLFNE